MPFSDDIFISYAHIDDRPLDDVKGWVTSFHERLNDRLAMLLGTELKIWWDQREQANQYLIGMIGERVSNTLLLVSIVTPRYVNSNWCRAEVREFCQRADQTGGIVIGNQPRVFKVIKTPVRGAQQPEELGGLLSYDFYEVDANGNAREFRQEIGSNKDLKYWAVFEDLAQGIKRALESSQLQDESQLPDPDQLPLAKKVYLAQTTFDLKDERDRIKRELLQRGFFVLPNRNLPLETAHEFEQAVREDMKRCALSVHLIGESYGSIPDGEEERSVVRWQSDIAAERSAGDAGFSRLIWMPPGLEAKGARHKELIEDLRTNLQAGSELLETSIEDLKTRILEKLSPQPQSTPGPGKEDNALTRVYLIHDNRDADDVKPIDDFLYGQGFEVIRSLSDGDESLVSQYHRDNLLQCDATLIYYGQGSELWLRSKLWDLQKAPGWGRSRPMKAKAVYVSAPATSSKQSFRTREVPLVMQNFGQFSEVTLQPFIQALRNGG